jgi:hypothetical protein
LSEKKTATLHEIKAKLKELYEKRGDKAVGDLADAIAAPNLFMKSHDSGPYTARLLELGATTANASALLLRMTGLTRDEAMILYARYTHRPQRGWIYTPSIVQSFGTGFSARATGGHNLDAAITGFRESLDVQRGQIKIIEEDGARVVLHNPADADKVGETVRTAAREKGTAEEIEAKLSASLQEAKDDNRALSEVLGVSAGQQSDASRGLATAHISPALDHTGWWKHEGALAEKQAALLGALNSDGSHAIVVERTAQGGYLLFDDPAVCHEHATIHAPVAA